MAGPYQPEFVKVSFDTFGISDNRRTSSGMDRRSKRSFTCKPILDFVETLVCSLVYSLQVSRTGGGTIVVDFFVNKRPETRQFIDVGISDT